jgi:hypothetical protein
MFDQLTESAGWLVMKKENMTVHACAETKQL